MLDIGRTHMAKKLRNVGKQIHRPLDPSEMLASHVSILAHILRPANKITMTPQTNEPCFLKEPEACYRVSHLMI